MSHLSLRWHICPRLIWLHQGFAHLHLNESCGRFLLLVDQLNIEIRQFHIPQFVCLAVWRFHNSAIVVCRLSSFRSCFKGKIESCWWLYAWKCHHWLCSFGEGWFYGNLLLYYGWFCKFSVAYFVILGFSLLPPCYVQPSIFYWTIN